MSTCIIIVFIIISFFLELVRIIIANHCFNTYAR